MRKHIQTLLLILLISNFAKGQTCYKVIANMNGLDISSFQSQLETVACQVKDTIPTAFQSEFGVFDFGFYQIFRTTQSGFDQAWIDAVQSANAVKKYNVIFGRETTSNGGVDVNFRVKINLPKSGQLSCLTNETISGTENEMIMLLNQKNKSYHLKEIEAMRVLNALIQRTLDCCSGNRSLSLIDTSKLNIQLCIDNCSNQFAKQNDVAIILDNIMPSVGFKLYYPQNLVVFCTNLFARITIQYIKDVNGTGRDRNDVETFTVSDIKVNDFVQINWNGKMQGGRVKIEILETALSPIALKTFNFTIKGKNPKIGEVMQYANSEYSDVWFMKKLMMHESGTFSSDASREMEHFNPYDKNHEKLHETWDAYSRCPKASGNGDGGFGLMQITNPIPTSKALWDWKQNIREGYDILTSKIPLVRNRLVPEIEIVKIWNADPNKPKVEKISVTYGGITWKIGASSVFGNGSTTINDYFNEPLGTNERSFLDACLLLAYNGYGGTGGNNFINLVTPQNEKPYWTTQDNVNTYVNRISEQSVPPPY